MSRLHPRRSAPLLAALALVLLAGCANPSADRLLVVDAPEIGGADPSVSVWAVRPGEEPDESNQVAAGATAPEQIVTIDDDGLRWNNGLGREWKGSTLLTFATQEGNVVTAGEPGERPSLLARAAATRTTVMRRGAFVETAEGCLLATSPGSPGTEDPNDPTASGSTGPVDPVGEGNCAISSDERWVVSWQLGTTGLSVRDLRSGDVVEVPDLEVRSAVPLATDARVLAVVADGDRSRAVVLDARTGEEVGRTPEYFELGVLPATAGADGFVALAALTEDRTEVALVRIDTDGTVEEIDRGGDIFPLTNTGEVTYLRWAEDLNDSSLRRWSPAKGTEDLIEGYVGAAAVDLHHVIATRETDEGVEIHREERGSGEMHRVLTVPWPEGVSPPQQGGAGVTVPQLWVHKKTAHLVLQGEGGSSYVRVDLVGDHSDVPVADAAQLRLGAMDSDATMLLVTGTSGEDGGVPGSELVVVRSHGHDVDRRATVEGIGADQPNLVLIRDGVVYFTGLDDQGQPVVRSVRAVGGDRTVRDRYPGHQLAGATWATQGGATESPVYTPLLLAQNREQAELQAAAEAAARAEALERAQSGDDLPATGAPG